MRRLALCAALALALVACGPPVETGSPSAPEPTPPTPRTTPAAEPTQTPDEEPADEVEATAFFVRDSGGRLWVEPEAHAVEAAAGEVARAALEVLIGAEPHDPNLTTLAPEGTEVLGISIADGILTLDLSEQVREGPGGSATEVAFAEQLAHTVAQFDEVDRLLLHVEGDAVDELWGHVDWSEPIEPDPFAVSQIDFTEPAWGEEVPAGEVTLRGESNTFEATHDLRLVSPDGEVVAEDFVTATSGSGERGTWQHTFTVTEPGRWTVEAEAPDASAGEGPPPFTTSLEFVVE